QRRSALRRPGRRRLPALRAGPPWRDAPDPPCASLFAPAESGDHPSARVLHPLLGHAMQRVTVDLVGRRERKLVDEPDEARMLVGRGIRQREALDLVLGGAMVAFRNDEGDGLLALDLVIDRHHRRLPHLWMALEHALDIAGIDVLATR